MNADLRARWDKLVAYVLEEYYSRGQDPNLNVEHDFAKRTVRLRVGGSSVSQTFTDAELLSDDLHSIARELCKAIREEAEND